MKYKVRITKQPRYQTGGSRTLGDFSKLTEDQLENGPVYGFKSKPELQETIVPVNTMQELSHLSIPTSKESVVINANPISISDLNKETKYSGVSVVDFLNKLGLPSSKPFRAKLAKNIGINNYTGTAAQNIKLIDYLNDPDNVIINLDDEISNYSKSKHKKLKLKKPEFVFEPLPYHGSNIDPYSLIPEMGIQQKEGLSKNQAAAAMAAQLGLILAPELLPYLFRTQYYPLPKGLPSPRVPQIPGPKGLPGRPFGGWSSSSGHVGPFQMGGEQDDDSQQQIIQVVKAYAQKSGVDPKTILLQLQKMQPEQQQQALQQMYAAVSQDTEDMSDGMMQDDSTEYAAYGGQMGYGLDLGARRLWMNQNDDESSQVTDSIEEVPREEANIEAEGGETALIPYKEDGSYLHKKIKGKRHTEGGVPLNVPEGTFIYSDTKKMKLGGPVLGIFGKSEKSNKKFTPADLAKQYNLDKYRAILEDDKSDHIAKRTAELMLQNYEKKLAQLALVQEGKKGYPQGIPQVAQNYYNQMLAASNKQGEDIEGTQEDRQELQEETQPQAMYGMGFKYGGGLKQFQGDINGSQVDTNAQNVEKSTYPSLIMPKYKSGNKTNISIQPVTFNKPNDSSKIKLTFEDEDFEENNKTYENDIKYGWTTPDKLNMLNSMINLASVKKYSPFEPTVQFQRPQTYYTDPSRALAANAEQMNASRQAAGMFAGPQSRYSFNAGQYGKNAADIIGQYAMQNIGIGNQAAQQNAAINNQQIQYDAQRAKRLYDAGVIGEQQYQNAMRQAKAAVLQAYTQGHENAANLYNLSVTESPYYGINPKTGTRYFRSEQARKDFFDPNKQNKNDNYFTMMDKLMSAPYNLSSKEAADAVTRLYGKQSSSKDV